MIDKYTVSFLDFSQPLSDGYMDLCGFKWTRGGATTDGWEDNVPAFNRTPYFNGTENTLSATLPAIGTQDFTWDMWIKPTASKAWSSVLEDVSGDLMIRFSTTISSNYVFTVSPGINPQAVFLNTWFHLRAVRKNNVAYAFFNGVAYGRASLTTNIQGGTYRFGEVWDNTVGYDYQGKIGFSHLRVGIGLTNEFHVPPFPIRLPEYYTKKVDRKSILTVPSVSRL